MTQYLDSFMWLMSSRPDAELASMRTSGALGRLLPEVDRLYGVPQNAEHHPEICTGIHIELCLLRAAEMDLDFAARFAVLVHDLGKGLTPSNEWPRHIDHENRGIAPVQDVCMRLEVADDVRKVSLLVCEWHLKVHRALEMRSTSLIRMIEVTGIETDRTLRRRFIGACRADALGRLGKESRPYFQAKLLEDSCSALESAPPLDRARLNTREGQARHRHRLDLIEPIRAHYIESQRAANETTTR